MLAVLVNLNSQEKSSVLLTHDVLLMKTEGVSFLGSGMNEDDAKTFAINDAKRNALEQAGTYLESHTTVLNQQLVKDEIITFSAGLVKVTVLNTTRKLVNDMFAFTVDIEAAIDIKLLDGRIKEIRNNEGLRRQLETEREKNKQLESRIAELQASGSTASKQTVDRVLDELSSYEWFDRGNNTLDNNLKIEYYTKAIELEPQHPEAYDNRGIAYTNLGNYDMALRDHTRAIELNPQYAFAYNNRGAVYGNLGKFAAAIEDYTKAVELYPQFVLAYDNRGSAYGNLGNFAMAVQDHTRAVELNPQYAFGYNNRGADYANLGNQAQAIQDYSKAIELNPMFAKAYYNRAFAHAVLGSCYAAVPDYSKALELDPQYADACLNRGICYYNLGSTDLAAQDYNSYLRMNGNNAGNAEQVRQWIRNLGYTPLY
jgi:tetratricopeptide (TPR) repeat protein